MSPISVAQYLSLDLEPFDLIIFDEASQMPTPEAIGAMARGKHVIVVGDPKQMPPTSFFSAQQFDEENAEKEDLESILDDCLALPMPSRYLLWHYRSRHESLIAFSNAKYYENKLLTFPSVDDIKTKVQWMHIEGFYDRSRARHNMAEGKAVVEEVLNRLRHTEHSKKSIGIVTFSSVQQKLIQDLLDEAFEKHPDLEIKATQSEEPLFIKNLENVQGDERDVILFSIGYGPDKEGKVYLNFGPINREGGWRRLNVAVSRARYEMKVFSTLRAAHIDLSRTASEGVAGLRAFLEYAEKGKHALPQSVGISGNLLGSFEMQLAEALRKKGHGIHTAVGTSGFKIDMAVVNPELPGEYLLAILCDGKPFEHIAAARDRFVGKMQVLRQLGWPVERVWATDWWNHPEKTISMLEESIQKAMESEHIADLFPKLSAPDTLSESLIENEPVNYNSLPPNSFPKYLPVVLPVVSSFSAVEFLWPQHEALIGSQLKKVIKGEAPIVRKLLYQRVLQAWSITRLGTRIQAALDSITEHLDADVKQINGQEIIAPKGFDWNAKLFRVPDDTNDKSRRDADVLPVTEVANAMHEILKQHFTLNAADLFRETSRIMGFARSGTNVETLMKASLKFALDNEIIFEKGGILMINQ
jgi:hypothetical protein